MNAKRRLLPIAVAVVLTIPLLGVSNCWQFGVGSPFLRFEAPLYLQLSLPGEIGVDLRMSGLVDEGSLVVELDGTPIDPEDLLPWEHGVSTLLEGVGEGQHRLESRADLRLLFMRFPLVAWTVFDAADLANADDCEILNNEECLLPFPSSRFLEPVGDETQTGLRTNIPALGLPEPVGDPLDPAPFNLFDGFSPTAQILMHFPQGVDLGASNAPVLLDPLCCAQSSSTPYVDVRTQDGRSVEFDSPSVLLDVDTGERILHWVELDARADEPEETPERQVLFLRPGKSLVPGHRYIVAVRGLQDPLGEPVQPEPAFRALRDRLPSTIPALEARRDHFEDIFRQLWYADVRRHDLVLAFDFVVRSDQQLTERLLAMRDDALAYVDGLDPADVSGFVLDDAFNAANVYGDCSDPGQQIWRHVKGTFEGPYYLTDTVDSFSTVPMLNVDENRMPVRIGTHPFNFDIAVPCSVFNEEDLGHPLLLGHGLFGNGAGMVESFAEGGGFIASMEVPYIAGATDWRGLSSLDSIWLALQVIGLPLPYGNRLNNFQALPDRLKQGQVNSLVLSHMMKTGFFNRLEELQRVPGDPSSGVFPGPGQEAFYVGISLGGIMGLHHAALSTDIERFNIDVGAINFSMLLQRATPFVVFDDLFVNIGFDDPMSMALGLGLLHELWVSAEPAAYVRHITGQVDEPLPGTPAKKILMTVAWLDKQVSNQASEIAARSLGLESLQGSLQAQLEEMPDGEDGPDGLDSAYVIYDTGSFDVFDPAYDEVVPPLANLFPSGVCDPHGRQFIIPASLDQLAAFLRPDGAIFNFCDGVCDASSNYERPDGVDEADLCDPLE
jgi:hypothetical protein